MPSIRIPNITNSKYAKPSFGEIFGNIWATKNIDLEINRGRMKLSDKCYEVFGSEATTGDADFDMPGAFIRTNADQTEITSSHQHQLITGRS